jgi:hypothetical protein
MRRLCISMLVSLAMLVPTTSFAQNVAMVDAPSTVSSSSMDNNTNHVISYDAFGVILPPHVSPKPKFDKVLGGLWAVDLTARLVDAQTTHTFLSNPCKCFAEGDPLAPGSPNWGHLLPFQFGIWAAVTVTSYELSKHRHRQIARLLASGDSGMEIQADIHNMGLHAPLVQTATSVK